MKIIRWISCHLIFLTVIISIAIAWYYRQELASDFASLTGKDTVSVVSTVVNAKQQQQQQQQQIKPEPPVPPHQNNGSSDKLAGAEHIDSKETPATLQKHSQRGSARNPAPSVSHQPGSTEQWPPAVIATPEKKYAPDIPGSGVVVTETESDKSPAYPDESRLEQGQRLSPGQPIVARSEPDTMYPPDDYDPEVVDMLKDNTGGNGTPFAVQESANFSTDSGAAAAIYPPQLASNDNMPDRSELPTPGQRMGVEQPFSNNFQAQLETARRYQWGGEFDNARQEYESLMAANPDNPEIASELGNLLMQQNRIDDAGRVYDSAIVNFRRLQRDNEAIGLIRFISRYNPVLADTLYNKYWQ